ncbi:MAG: FecR family protein [Nitrospira sp.]|nr:FecR family protein [Nitrospira sp.]
MTQPTPTSTSDSLREQAVHWIVRLHSGSATNTDRRDFDAWLASSPEHRREFDAVSRMWSVLNDTQSLLQAEIQQAEDLWTSHDAIRQRERRWWWWPGTQAAVVSSALMLLLIVTAWWWTGRPETMLYETAKGAQRQVILTDGSSVTLNTDTRLTVEFSRNQRAIRLERGEAWFTVSHDERRPFTVHIANSTIRDIGTQFIVDKSSDGVLVSVWEGIVEVEVPASGGGTPSPRPAVLRAGQQVSYGTDGRMSDVGFFDRNRVGSWKEGKLIFRSQPLKQVLEEISRYRPENITLLDPNLGALPVSGVFNIQELDRVVETLQAALPIRAQRVRENLILIEPVPALSPVSKSPQ